MRAGASMLKRWILSVLAATFLLCLTTASAVSPTLSGPNVLAFSEQGLPQILHAREELAPGIKLPNGSCEFRVSAHALPGHTVEVRQLAYNRATCEQLVKVGTPSAIPALPADGTSAHSPTVAATRSATGPSVAAGSSGDPQVTPREH